MGSHPVTKKKEASYKRGGMQGWAEHRAPGVRFQEPPGAVGGVLGDQDTEEKAGVFNLLLT